MKKFLLTLALFSFVLFLVLNLIAIPVIEYTPHTEMDRRLELVINGKINKDIIILGSSRGVRDIHSQQLAKETGHSAYNLSYLGANIDFQQFVLKTLILYDSIPKLVILNMDEPNALLHDWTLNFRWEKLYPLVKYDYVLREIADREEKYYWLARIFPLHRVCKTNFHIKQREFTAFDSISHHGDMPLYHQRKQFTKKYQHTPTSYRVQDELPEKVAAYQNILSMCKQHHIELLIAFTPNFRSHSIAFENRIKEISGEDVFYFVFNQNNPVYKNSNYFNDESHMMSNGATVYTHELASYINSHKTLKEALTK